MTRKIIYFTLAIALTFAHAFETRAADIKDTGDFKIGFAPVKGKKQKELDPEMKASLQGLADGLNGTFALPTDVYIATDECGESNAFYESKRKQLTMCYELYAEFD